MVRRRFPDGAAASPDLLAEIAGCPFSETIKRLIQLFECICIPLEFPAYVIKFRLNSVVHADGNNKPMLSWAQRLDPLRPPATIATVARCAPGAIALSD